MKLLQTPLRSVAAGLLALLAACGGSELETAPSSPGTADTPTATVDDREGGGEEAGRCADVIDVEVRGDGGRYRFDVTVSSDDTGWDKYADSWEVRAPDGTVLGVRVLTHPHETEQPFTRSLGGVEIPEGVREVTVAAHDSVLGFCGLTMTVSVPEGT